MKASKKQSRSPPANQQQQQQRPPAIKVAANNPTSAKHKKGHENPQSPTHQPPPQDADIPTPHLPDPNLAVNNNTDANSMRDDKQIVIEDDQTETVSQQTLKQLQSSASKTVLESEQNRGDQSEMTFTEKVKNSRQNEEETKVAEIKSPFSKPSALNVVETDITSPTAHRRWFHKLVIEQADEPQPLLNKAHRRGETTLVNGQAFCKLPRFMFGEVGGLGKINGRPKAHQYMLDSVQSDACDQQMELSQYIKEAFSNGLLHYQRFVFNLKHGHFTSDPIGTVVSINEILNGKYKDMLVARTTKQLRENLPLEFDSRFESGNLALAMRRKQSKKQVALGKMPEYDLVLQNDVNTRGHVQWFFFRVKANIKTSARINLLNHTKPDSLFNYGMRILVSSDKHFDGKWCRAGRDIEYYQNNFRKEGAPAKNMFYYTLTFTYDFQADETVYFAYCYPYTHAMLKADIDNIFRQPERRKHVTKEVLFTTMAGSKGEMLTITDSNCTEEEDNAKKGVIITARIHPGESNGSYIMKGVLDYLTDPDSLEVHLLLKTFVFKIVPMVNIDGVSAGNYRGSLSGMDLNRKWKAPNPLIFPELVQIKRMAQSFAQRRQVVLYCDLHGHSRARQAFMYGNDYPVNPEQTRLFPFIFGMLDANNQHFTYNKCTFGQTQGKEGTGRVVMWNLLNIPAVYTLEASLCGGSSTGNAPHFTPDHLALMGKNLCMALLVYLNVPITKVRGFKPQELQLERKAAIDAFNKEEDLSVKEKGFVKGEGKGNDSLPAADDSPQAAETPTKSKKSKDDDEDKEEEENQNESQDDLEKNDGYLSQKSSELSNCSSAEMMSQHSCSDSEPSLDNLDEEEFVQIVPVKMVKELQLSSTSLFQKPSKHPSSSHPGAGFPTPLASADPLNSGRKHPPLMILQLPELDKLQEQNAKAIKRDAKNLTSGGLFGDSVCSTQEKNRNKAKLMLPNSSSNSNRLPNKLQESLSPKNGLKGKPNKKGANLPPASGKSSQKHNDQKKKGKTPGKWKDQKDSIESKDQNSVFANPRLSVKNVISPLSHQENQIDVGTQAGSGLLVELVCSRMESYDADASPAGNIIVVDNFENAAAPQLIIDDSLTRGSIQGSALSFNANQKSVKDDEQSQEKTTHFDDIVVYLVADGTGQIDLDRRNVAQQTVITRPPFEKIKEINPSEQQTPDDALQSPPAAGTLNPTQQESVQNVPNMFFEMDSSTTNPAKDQNPDLLHHSGNSSRSYSSKHGNESDQKFLSTSPVMSSQQHPSQLQQFQAMNYQVKQEPKNKQQRHRQDQAKNVLTVHDMMQSTNQSGTGIGLTDNNYNHIYTGDRPPSGQNSFLFSDNTSYPTTIQHQQLQNLQNLQNQTLQLQLQSQNQGYLPQLVTNQQWSNTQQYPHVLNANPLLRASPQNLTSLQQMQQTMRSPQQMMGGGVINAKVTQQPFGRRVQAQALERINSYLLSESPNRRMPDFRDIVQGRKLAGAAGELQISSIGPGQQVNQMGGLGQLGQLNQLGIGGLGLGQMRNSKQGHVVNSVDTARGQGKNNNQGINNNQMDAPGILISSQPQSQKIRDVLLSAIMGSPQGANAGIGIKFSPQANQINTSWSPHMAATMGPMSGSNSLMANSPSNQMGAGLSGSRVISNGVQNQHNSNAPHNQMNNMHQRHSHNQSYPLQQTNQLPTFQHHPTVLSSINLSQQQLLQKMDSHVQQLPSNQISNHTQQPNGDSRSAGYYFNHQQFLGSSINSPQLQGLADPQTVNNQNPQMNQMMLAQISQMAGSHQERKGKNLPPAGPSQHFTQSQNVAAGGNSQKVKSFRKKKPSAGQSVGNNQLVQLSNQTPGGRNSPVNMSYNTQPTQQSVPERRTRNNKYLQSQDAAQYPTEGLLSPTKGEGKKNQHTLQPMMTVTSRATLPQLYTQQEQVRHQVSNNNQGNDNHGSQSHHLQSQQQLGSPRQGRAKFESPQLNQNRSNKLPPNRRSNM